MNPVSFTDALLSPLAHRQAMPRDGQLHMGYWRASDVMQDAIHLLGDDECDRCGRFATSELQRCFIAAHAGVRQILASYLNVSASDLVFSLSSAGKPFLPASSLRFNLSHSGDAALLAVAMADVGVDIERLRNVTSLASLATRHFARQELDAMRLSDDPERAFFTTWTRKEAVVKLTGLGLAAGVQELNTSAIHDAVHVPERWRFPSNECWVTDVAIDTQHVAAVATRDKPQEICLFRGG